MADKSQISDAIEDLALHCRPPLMAIEQRLRWTQDWCADLAEFPIEAILAGCRKWRHGGSTKFPTAGQLLPLVREGLPVEKREDNRPWRPATEAEYQAMTVREKIREQLILAGEASQKQGPMFRNGSSHGEMSKAVGEHLTEDQMPDVWRRWREIARNHRQEAARLRTYLGGEFRPVEQRPGRLHHPRPGRGS